MKRILFWSNLLIISLIMTASAWARAPLGGLAVAVSPDGKTIVSGGDNRTLYVIDGESLEVKKRIWFKSTIWNLEFNKDGSKLLIEDTSPAVYYLETQNWQIERELKSQRSMSAARNADLCATTGNRGKTVSFISMSDGSLKGKITLDLKASAFGINADGTRIAILSHPKKDESEKEVKYRDIPKDLKGADRKEFKQKNDGKTSFFYIFEVPSGKELLKKKTYYGTTSNTMVLFDGDTVLAVNYSNENAKFNAKGEAEIFELLNSYNYGLGASADQKLIGSGGLAKLAYTKVEGLVSTVSDIDKLPGWPEYFKDFAFDSKGNAYGTTTGFRLIKINPGGVVEKAVPIY